MAEAHGVFAVGDYIEISKGQGGTSVEKNRATPGDTKSYWDRMTAIGTFILAIASLGTLIFAWVQMGDTRSGAQRQISEMRDEAHVQIDEMRGEARAQHLTTWMEKLDSPQFLSLRRSLALKRIDRKLKRLHELDPDDIPVELDDELTNCDNIGLLTDRGYLDRHDVWYAFGQWLLYLREDARPYLDTLSGPADYQKCINLVESIRPIEEKENKGAYNHPSEDDLYNYYQQDIDRLQGEPANQGRAPKKH